MPEIILDSIDLVHQRQSWLDKETLRRRAIELAGKYQSGVTDLSEAHDHYLVRHGKHEYFVDTSASKAFVACLKDKKIANG